MSADAGNREENHGKKGSLGYMFNEVFCDIVIISGEESLGDAGSPVGERRQLIAVILYVSL
jgi:hypothetical protein